MPLQVASVKNQLRADVFQENVLACVVEKFVLTSSFVLIVKNTFKYDFFSEFHT